MVIFIDTVLILSFRGQYEVNILFYSRKQHLVYQNNTPVKLISLLSVKYLQVCAEQATMLLIFIKSVAAVVVIIVKFFAGTCLHTLHVILSTITTFAQASFCTRT